MPWMMMTSTLADGPVPAEWEDNLPVVYLAASEAYFALAEHFALLEAAVRLGNMEDFTPEDWWMAKVEVFADGSIYLPVDDLAFTPADFARLRS